MDNMTSAATNDKSVLEQLVTTTTTQYAAIKSLLQEITPSAAPKQSDRNPGSDRNPDKNEMHNFKK